jgi:hypothetical protein
MTPTFNQTTLAVGDSIHRAIIPQSTPMTFNHLLGGMNTSQPILANSGISAARINRIIELNGALDRIQSLSQRHINPSPWLNRILILEQMITRQPGSIACLPTTKFMGGPNEISSLLLDSSLRTKCFADHERKQLIETQKKQCPPSFFAMQTKRRYVPEKEISDLDILCGRGGKSNK